MAAVTLAVAVAVLKPWGGTRTAGDVHARVADAQATPAPATGAPAVSSVPSPVDVAAATIPVPGASSLDCFSTDRWLLVADGSLAGRRVRSWTAVAPAGGSGPVDATIPVADVAADDVSALGFCAPAWATPPAASWQATLWSLGAGPSRSGPVQAAAVARITAPPGHLGMLALAGVVPVPGGTATPPAASPAGAGAGPVTWPPGRYVMELRVTPSTQRGLWLGVRLESISR